MPHLHFWGLPHLHFYGLSDTEVKRYQLRKSLPRLRQAKSTCNIDSIAIISTKVSPLYLIIDCRTGAFVTKLPESDDKIYLKFNKNENLFLACPGVGNHLIVKDNHLPHNLYKASCHSDNNLMINSKIYNSAELECYLPLMSTVKISGRCLSHGSILEVGYEFGDDQQAGWLQHYSVCHDIDKATTYYTKHPLYGTTLKSGLIKNPNEKRPKFMKGPSCLFRGSDPKNDYSKTNQEKVIKDAVGERKANNYIVQNKKFMTRGHLVPKGDFVYQHWRNGTFYFFNVAPQWNAINSGRWNEIETKVKQLSITLNTQLDVYTGTSRVLKLKKDKCHRRNIFLSRNGKIPVPKYFWKIILNPRDQSCMGFVCTNNPNLQEAPQPICKDICKDHKWELDNSKLCEGYAYCCKYDEMKQVIREVPEIGCKVLLSHA